MQGLKLWAEVFDDGDFFSLYSQKRELKPYFREKSGEIVSQAFTVKVKASLKGDEAEVNLITGLATKKEYRNQGLASSLIEQIKQESKLPLVLYPAVRRFYEGLGFKSGKGFEFTLPQKAINANKDPDISFLNYIYERSLSSYLKRDEWAWSTLLEDHDVVTSDDGYALIDKRDNKATEAAAFNPSSLLKLIGGKVVPLPCSKLEEYLLSSDAKHSVKLLGMSFPYLDMYIAEQY